MERLLRVLGVGVTVALVSYSIVLLFGDSEADEVVAGALADAEHGADSKAARKARERLAMMGRGLASNPDGTMIDNEVPIASEAPMPSTPYGSGEIDSKSARDGFEYAMGKVDTVVKSRRRISPQEWEALYRETNDAFSALSIVLDAADEAQMAELEEAHKRLKLGLRKVRVAGRKLAR